MTPELQSVLDRLDEVERRRRGPSILSILAALLSIATAAYTYTATLRMVPPPAAPRLSGVVEANRFLLRGLDGEVKGGMEVERDGTVKLVNGNQNGRTGAAVILAQPTGLVQLQLRSPAGVVRSALNGGVEPSLTLTSDDGASSATLVAKPGSPGQLFLSDRTGTLRRGP